MLSNSVLYDMHSNVGEGKTSSSPSNIQHGRHGTACDHRVGQAVCDGTFLPGLASRPQANSARRMGFSSVYDEPRVHLAAMQLITIISFVQRVHLQLDMDAAASWHADLPSLCPPF